jgi:heptosyltransferase-2
MGAVVRSTSLLAAMKRKYPSSHITWITEKPMHGLLNDHPRIDRVLTTSNEDQLALRALEFDIAFVIDKSLTASGLLRLTKADLVYGFLADPATGAILPATSAAEELWQLGLDDHQKFFMNQKPETRLLNEALELGPHRRDEYDLPLSLRDREVITRRQINWRLQTDQPIIGFNTGCGPLMPAKKWTVEFHQKVLKHFLSLGYVNLVLLGGPEDEERNREIGKGLPVIQTQTRNGVRDGLHSIAACDLIVSGDSFAMHLAIAMKKFVVAWFGPSCAHEIDLYDRGIALRAAVACSPCWKRHCAKTQMCYDQVPLQEIETAVEKGRDWWTLNNPQNPSPQALLP